MKKSDHPDFCAIDPKTMTIRHDVYPDQMVKICSDCHYKIINMAPPSIRKLRLVVSNGERVKEDEP